MRQRAECTVGLRLVADVYPVKWRHFYEGDFMKIIFTLAALILLTGCTPDKKQPAINSEPMERTMIVGSAESPDPVLTKVRELEKSGVVKDVVVLESFPVQIQLRAPKKTIEELNKIPRVGGLH